MVLTGEGLLSVDKGNDPYRVQSVKPICGVCGSE